MRLVEKQFRMRNIALKKQGIQEKVLVSGKFLVLKEKINGLAKMAQGKEFFLQFLYLIEISTRTECYPELF